MIKIIDNIEELRTIKESLNILADKFEMPFSRFEWIKNCAETLRPKEKIKIFILIEDGELKSVIPLALKKNFIYEGYEIIGSSLHKEPECFLYKDEESLYRLLKAIIESGKTLYIRGIRTCSIEAQCIERLLKEKRLAAAVKDAHVLFLPVSGSWDSFLETISSSRRSSIKRLKRIAERSGELKAQIITPDAGTIDSLLEEVFQVEASNWKIRMGTSMLYNSRLGTFFRNYLKDISMLGFSRFCFLRINDKPVAVQLGMEYANRLWILKIGFDENWSKCSPGIILMNEVIKYAFDKKISSVEFLGGDEPWLHIWTDLFHDLIAYQIYQPNFIAVPDLISEFSSGAVSKLHLRAVKSLSRKRRLYTHD